MIIKKSIFIFLLIITIFITGCSSDDFNGSDTIITFTRNLPAFTKIIAQDDLEVNVIQNGEQNVEIVVNDNLQGQIRTNVNNNTLFISLEDGNYMNDNFVVNIKLANLERLELNDNTSGVVNFNTNLLEFEVNDSSKLSLQGSSEILNTKINDAGKINAFSFTTSVLNTMSRDASELEITCTSELKGIVSDAAKVSYRGMPNIKAITSADGKIINAN